MIAGRIFIRNYGPKRCHVMFSSGVENTRPTIIKGGMDRKDAIALKKELEVKYG